jgi:hypothetical protein
MKRIVLVLVLMSCIFSSRGVTWDEPWQEEILNKSDYFILGRVIDPKPGSVKIKVLKQFGDKKIEDVITLEGFHMLRICTKADSENVTFFFQMIDSVYLFLKKTDIGYCIPTPTSGYAIVTGGKVLSTFRHSFHQAHLPVATYEKCTSAIWNSVKGIVFDKKPVMTFIEQNLKQKPAGFRDDQLKLFFNQHAALEVLYFMKDQENFPLIKPFVNCANNHLMISAVRCLSNYNTDESKKMLLAFIGDSSKDNFTKIMAVWSLKNLSPKEMKTQIRKVWETASEETIAFTTNTNDPRVCTSLPTIKEAMEELLSTL